MSVYHPDGRNRNLRRQADAARQTAVAGDWPRAVELNRTILEQSPRDVDAWNRLGKAQTELGSLDEALDAYRAALTIDPGNVIAQRNVERLETAPTSSAAETGSAPMQAGVFVEEAGKTYITDLIRPAASDVIARVAPADEVRLASNGRQVDVQDRDGRRLGQLEPRIAQRLIKLLGDGNRYQAFVVAMTGNTVRVILREMFHNPEAPELTSFPRQAKIAAPRPYLRETGRLSRELEPGLLLDSDEDDDDDSDDDEVEEVEGLEDEAEEEEFSGEHASTEEEEPQIER
ncbi:MAG TPA: tetratricopeptide repeat protein [Thermomicrobiaceae bacterium]|nr:tetratricopeptide repeat protein [Thermomicrobiaceae bacterium]